MLEKAILVATKAHEGQKRKNSTEAYVEHPIRVAQMLKESGFRDEVVIAGVLHDTVEDTSLTIAEIDCVFGEEVANIVAAHTEDKSLSWEERKSHTIASIKSVSLEVKALIIADKLDNLLSLMDSYDKIGEKTWEAFKRGREQQAWYYKSIVEAIEDVENAPAFFNEYKTLVDTFYK